MSDANEFPIQEISVPSEERRDEQLGSKAKFWFTGIDNRDWLFKQARQNEDWSEKVAEVLAGYLGLPHAEIELARCSGQSGIVSPSFLQQGDQLVHGNELLFELDTKYPIKGTYNIHAHTVEAVSGALKRFQVTPWDAFKNNLPGWFDGEDLFLGYLLFDAWIGNGDRHHENWAVVQRGEQKMLSPTYDHGSSMGRNETQDRASSRLTGKDPRLTVDSYVQKCRSALFNPQSLEKPMHPVEAFFHAARLRPASRDYWLSRLQTITDNSVQASLQRVPDSLISSIHRDFAYAIIMNNRGRLLAAQPRNGND